MKSAVMMSFEKMKSWQHYNGFSYDSISDDDINDAFNYSEYFRNISLNAPWQYDQYLYETKDIPERLKHQARIALLITILKKDMSKLEPVSFWYRQHRKGNSGIYDGNHRIRALQYLGSPHFPAYATFEPEEREEFEKLQIIEV